MKDIVITSGLKVKATGNDSDFIAVIENKSEHDIRIDFLGEHNSLEPFIVPGNDWVGLLADESGYMYLAAFENNNWRVA